MNDITADTNELVDERGQEITVAMSTSMVASINVPLKPLVMRLTIDDAWFLNCVKDSSSLQPGSPS